jgi:hypothetical protein
MIRLADYRTDLRFTFQKHKEMADKAIGQLSDDDFFRKPAEHVNSVAIIVKHLAGNLKSRFTDFLTSDGEKPDRDRDAEFVIAPDDTRERLLAAWEHGWSALFISLDSLQEGDWPRTITIRGEAHSVMQALHRALAHTAYHVGQIVYVARLLKEKDWTWLTIPPGQSKLFNRKYLK